MENIKEIRVALEFNTVDDVISVEKFGNGYVHKTFLVTYKTGDSDEKKIAILQKINRSAFPDVDMLVRNHFNAANHIAEYTKNVPDNEKLLVQEQYMAKNGKYYVMSDGEAWRMLKYIGNTHTMDIPENTAVFKLAGEIFGKFAKIFADYPTDEIDEVIPNFHNTYSRYKDLERAIRKDPCGRVTECQREIEILKNNVDLMPIITNALENGEIPLRITHNDTNLNNILFDDITNRPIAVIDLDTVMPSTPLYDYGDSMRIGTNTAKDDEKDLSLVSCDLDMYRAYAEGYLSVLGNILTEKEWELLPYSSIIITMEDSIRFLTDHINGDRYYNIEYEGQNLDRCRTQIKLFTDMKEKLPEIRNIISQIRADVIKRG